MWRLAILKRLRRRAHCLRTFPPPRRKPKSYAAWNKAFATWLFQTQALDLFASPSLGAGFQSRRK